MIETSALPTIVRAGEMGVAFALWVITIPAIATWIAIALLLMLRGSWLFNHRLSDSLRVAQIKKQVPIAQHLPNKVAC